jgi:hypothetical protein
VPDNASAMAKGNPNLNVERGIHLLLCPAGGSAAGSGVV